MVEVVLVEVDSVAEVSVAVAMEAEDTAEAATGEVVTVAADMAEAVTVVAATQVAGLHRQYTRSLLLSPPQPLGRRAQSWRQSAGRPT